MMALWCITAWIGVNGMSLTAGRSRCRDGSIIDLSAPLLALAPCGEAGLWAEPPAHSVAQARYEAVREGEIA